jgi:hypothetical protein
VGIPIEMPVHPKVGEIIKSKLTVIADDQCPGLSHSQDQDHPMMVMGGWEGVR